MRTERGGVGALLFLAAVVFFLMKMSEGPRTATAVGQYEIKPTYDASQPVIKYQEPYRLPTNCKTTSWDGPYKHDGRTYSTTCN